MEEKLIEIRETLDHVEVRGQQNLYFLLGALQELDKMIADMKNKEVTADG